MIRKLALGAVAASLALLTHGTASAQTAEPERDSTWGGVTNATAAAAIGVGVLMPRVFYPSTEVTVGFKARWHISVLAPMMTYASFALLNEAALKGEIKSKRPGCDDSNASTHNCSTFGGPSSHAFVAGSTLGHGIAVFLFDTTKWSNGQASAVGGIGHIAVPLILGGITVIGRSAGNYENGGQIVAGAGMGLVTGFLLGTVYATMARPECGYSGSLICW
jgi:hypothetical protein